MKRHRKFLVLAMAILIAVVTVFLTRSLQTKPAEPGTLCLTAADYADLTGGTAQDTLSPSDNFYTQTIGFATGSAEYSDAASAKETVEGFGVFYKNHPTKSVLFAVSSDYTGTDEKAAAQERIDRLASDLKAAGIHEDAIQTSNPTQINNTEDTSTSFATITISSSDVACQE